MQGSYGNDTNIYAESDVDVVIRLDSTFKYDLSQLPKEQAEAFRASVQNATYSFEEFREGVELRLGKAFGSDVNPGNKAIQIKANGSRRKADVVVCYQYRLYSYYLEPLFGSSYTEGIVFPTQSSGTIINFPKLHSAQLTTKHQQTSQWFKPAVRILKNMRSRMVDEGLIARGTAPSYYLEGLLSNVPNGLFGTSYRETIFQALNWLLEASSAQFVCAHGKYLLLGKTNVQWPEGDYNSFMEAAKSLWNDW